MNADALAASVGLPAATLVYCFVAGLVPVLNVEVFLVAVASTARSSVLPAVVVMAAIGQTLAKVVLYLAGRGVVRIPLRRAGDSLERVRARVERWKSRDLLVAVSAVAGIPPLYAVSILAGSLRYPPARFTAIALAGRFLRFAAVAGLPWLGRWIAGLGP